MTKPYRLSAKGLVALAREVQNKAYAPYSSFRVGAALLGKSGKVYAGCNVENASYGLSCCAERNAVFKAVSEGERQFTALAICSDSPHPIAPCGACRQVLYEFGPEMEVIMAGSSLTVKARLKQLLPLAFGPKALRTDNTKGNPSIPPRPRKQNKKSK
jgi:cytidine deaminase